MAPTHGHMLFVGWFIQFALGIALWLLPRTRSDLKPLGYRERPILIAIISLNSGLLLRVVIEPLDRSGHGGTLADVALVTSALLQLSAIVLFVIEIWPRVASRAPKKRSPANSLVQAEEKAL